MYSDTYISYALYPQMLYIQRIIQEKREKIPAAENSVYNSEEERRKSQTFKIGV